MNETNQTTPAPETPTRIFPATFPPKSYFVIEGSRYIMLEDGQVARLLTPTKVEHREYFNLKFPEKTRRVSRKWMLTSIAQSLGISPKA
jgi:hypothetical protein